MTTGRESGNQQFLGHLLHANLVRREDMKVYLIPSTLEDYLIHPFTKWVADGETEKIIECAQNYGVVYTLSNFLDSWNKGCFDGDGTVDDYFIHIE